MRSSRIGATMVAALVGALLLGYPAFAGTPEPAAPPGAQQAARLDPAAPSSWVVQTLERKAAAIVVGCEARAVKTTEVELQGWKLDAPRVAVQADVFTVPKWARTVSRANRPREPDERPAHSVTVREKRA